MDSPHASQPRRDRRLRALRPALKTRTFSRDLRPCRPCETQISQFITGWQTHLSHILADTGPRSAQWQAMWDQLRFEQIPETIGRDAAAAAGLAHLERMVTFAFADGEIDNDEITTFTRTITELALPPSPQLSAMQQRMHGGHAMTKIRNGDLPTANPPDIHLDSGEILHLDTPAQLIRHLTNGPKATPGRLLVSNKKIRFIGTGGGQTSWDKIVGVRTEYSTVVISAANNRGLTIYHVNDVAYAAAVTEGALRIAKRLILTPRQRDTRYIPPHIKNEVYRRCGGRCAECGSTSYLEFDHVLPLSLGGATSANNLQLLCRACNLAKGARI